MLGSLFAIPFGHGVDIANSYFEYEKWFVGLAVCGDVIVDRLAVAFGGDLL